MFDMFPGKACVLCIGCPESRIDSNRVKNFLKENDWIVTNRLKEADLVLFRTCGLTNFSIDNSVQLIKKLKAEKKRDAKLIAWGCLPKINRKALRSVYSDITFGEDEIEILDKIVKANKSIAEIKGNSCMPVFIPKQGLKDRIRDYFSKTVHDICTLKDPFFQLRTVLRASINRDIWKLDNSVFQIKVSTGCLGRCTYCSIPKSRGILKSKSVEEIVSEFRDGMKKGFQYFALIGTDLGAYGRDLRISLVDLLSELTKINGNYKIGLRNLNPNFLIEMYDELRPFFASGKIWFLSSAVQSGSDRVLKRMARDYSAQDYIRCVSSLNQEFPHVHLRTQIIVGFPGETDQDFKMSQKLLDNLRFDFVELYKYSRNSDTQAAKMPNQIPEQIKEVRYRKLYSKIPNNY